MISSFHTAKLKVLYLCARKLLAREYYERLPYLYKDAKLLAPVVHPPTQWH